MIGWQFYVAAVVFVIIVIALAIANAHEEERQGWVYFIGGRHAGPIKVGVTRGDPHDRMKDLQTGSAVKLHLHGAFSVDDNLYDVEGRLHNALASYHVGGEWYQREPSLLVMRELVQ